MNTLTGQELISSMAEKLRSRFSEQQIKAIYKDTPTQSVVTPYIFLHSVETSHTPQLRRYAMWDHIIDIRCHPEKMRLNIQTWARSLAIMIIDTVKYLTVSDQQVKAKSISWKVEDNVLHIIATYSFRVVEVPESIPDMQILEYGQRIKQ